MAVNDDMIRKNPFKCKLSDGIPNDAYVQSALTKARQERYLQYIRIRKQLCRTADKPYFIAPLKTSSGTRSIPMTDAVCMAFRRVLENRGHPKADR